MQFSMLCLFCYRVFSTNYLQAMTSQICIIVKCFPAISRDQTSNVKRLLFTDAIRVMFRSTAIVEIQRKVKTLPKNLSDGYFSLINTRKIGCKPHSLRLSAIRSLMSIKQTVLRFQSPQYLLNHVCACVTCIRSIQCNA